MRDADRAPGYAIDGGRTDQDRLDRQATVMSAHTMQFLTRLGVHQGMTCLDVGCGNGQVSIAMARLVGPTGRVVGLDADPVALEIAREAALSAGVEITFVEGDAATPVEEDAFDVALCRLVLSHQVDSVSVLRAMQSSIRPDGVVAVEDLYTPSLHADPDVPALTRLADVYATTVRAHGGDPTIGPRLRAQLAAVGLRGVTEATVVNPMTSARDKMFLVQLLDNMNSAILGSHAATADDLTELRADLVAAAERDGVTFYQARMHQVSGRREA